MKDRSNCIFLIAISLDRLEWYLWNAVRCYSTFAILVEKTFVSSRNVWSCTSIIVFTVYLVLGVVNTILLMSYRYRCQLESYRYFRSLLSLYCGLWSTGSTTPAYLLLQFLNSRGIWRLTMMVALLRRCIDRTL